nr:hypothetical protein [Leptospira weilii]
MTESGNWWIYSPEEKNSLGEKQLYFFGHSGGTPEKLDDINLGTLFLNRLKSIFEEVKENRQNEAPVERIVTDVIEDVYQRLYNLLRSSKFEGAKRFVVEKIAELKVDFRARHETDKANGVSLEKGFPEMFVADLLAFAAITKDAECFQMAFDLLEGYLKNPSIYLNAACYHALTGNKESLLESVRLARALDNLQVRFEWREILKNLGEVRILKKSSRVKK